jgi:hypothetical protein
LGTMMATDIHALSVTAVGSTPKLEKAKS